MTEDQITELRQKPKTLRVRELDGSRALWHRQSGESVQAYQAFMAYLMADAQAGERTLSKVALTLEKSHSLLKRWSFEWSWQLRVAAYEEHYLLVRLDSVEADRDRMWLRQQSLAATAISVVEARLRDLVKKIEDETLREDFLKPDALTRLLDIATKLDRMAVLGRAANAAEAQERNAKLAEMWSDELAETLEQFINEMQLPADKQKQARQALERVLLGAGPKEGGAS